MWARMPGRASRSPPPLLPPPPPLPPHLLPPPRHCPSSPTWALAPPPGRANLLPISSLWAPAARRTSAREAGQEAAAQPPPPSPLTTRVQSLAPPTSRPAAAVPPTPPSRPCCRSTAAARSWCAPWITATARGCRPCPATVATRRTHARAPSPGSAPRTTPLLQVWLLGGRPCRAWQCGTGSTPRRHTDTPTSTGYMGSHQQNTMLPVNRTHTRAHTVRFRDSNPKSTPLQMSNWRKNNTLNAVKPNTPLDIEVFNTHTHT